MRPWSRRGAGTVLQKREVGCGLVAIASLSVRAANELVPGWRWHVEDLHTYDLRAAAPRSSPTTTTRPSAP